MGSSAGRRKADYVAFRRHLQLTRPPCSIRSGPWCTGVGLTVEHSPPLSSFPHPDLWRGTWSGACQPCQSRQGAAIRNGAKHRTHWVF